MLTDIEAGADETEGLHLAAQAKEIAVGDGRAPVAAKADVEQVEVRRQIVGRRVSSRFTVERRTQAPPGEGELAPVGFVLRPWGKGVGIIRQLYLIAPDRSPQLVANLGQARGLTQVPCQLANPLAVTRQEHPALQPQR